MMFSIQSLPMTRKALALITLAASVAMASSAHATIVQFQTPVGDFEVHLYDHDPAVKATVDNFLNYVRGNSEEHGDYSDSIIHRSVSDFVIQGGSFTYKGTLPPTAITPAPRITNQPVYSNVAGTIAMAKVDGFVNSASSSWFINIEDNSEYLDRSNGGFTVFGQVDSSDMSVIEALAAIDRFNMGGVFNTIPLLDYTAEDAANNVPVDESNFVFTDIVILDENPNSSSSLNPVRNTLVNKKDDSSGSVHILLLSLLSLLALGRKYRFNRD